MTLQKEIDVAIISVQLKQAESLRKPTTLRKIQLQREIHQDWIMIKRARQWLKGVNLQCQNKDAGTLKSN